jgi:hypothetical protein
MVEGAEWDILREIQKGLHDRWSDDVVVLAMRDLEKSKSKTLRSSEWAKEDGLWRFHDCIYVPMIPDLHHRIAEQHHDSRIAGHAGQWKTLKLVSQSYWWPNMSPYISQYCKACDMCLHRNGNPLANYTHSQSLRHNRMWSVSTLSPNFLIRMDLMHQ